LEGILQFARDFRGELTTETMLVQGINDDREEIGKTVELLVELKPDKSYLAIPTRPPAARSVKAPREQAITAAFQEFSERLNSVEYLIGYEGDAFASTGDVSHDLLSITSVHPMRQEAVADLLGRTHSGWETVEKLVRDGALVELTYRGQKFYMRSLPGRQRFQAV
jgi:wyosine [tRNA(Phe)-imidazoG37] synthetase (radical SAM superfamily)